MCLLKILINVRVAGREKKLIPFLLPKRLQLIAAFKGRLFLTNQLRNDK